jgi:hypothetical protein
MLTSELRIRIPVLWNRNDLLRFRFRLWKNFGFGSGSSSDSGSRQYLAQFSASKTCAKSCFFNVRSSFVSQKFGLTFDFLTFVFCKCIHFILDPDPSKYGSGIGTEMHSGSGSAMQKVPVLVLHHYRICIKVKSRI